EEGEVGLPLAAGEALLEVGAAGREARLRRVAASDAAGAIGEAAGLAALLVGAKARLLAGGAPLDAALKTSAGMRRIRKRHRDECRGEYGHHNSRHGSRSLFSGLVPLAGGSAGPVVGKARRQARLVGGDTGAPAADVGEAAALAAFVARG